MPRRTFCLRTASCAAIVLLSAGLAWALGFELGETKDQLGLKYDVAVQDHGTGRVTVTLTIADDGRLKPLRSVDLVVPSDDGAGHVDLALSLALKDSGGKRTASVHLKRALAERAEIHLVTDHLDGKQLALTWYYHVIRLADHIRRSAPKKP
jgi:hypothetical protein